MAVVHKRPSTTAWRMVSQAASIWSALRKIIHFPTVSSVAPARLIDGLRAHTQCSALSSVGFISLLHVQGNIQSTSRFETPYTKSEFITLQTAIWFLARAVRGLMAAVDHGGGAVHLGWNEKGTVSVTIVDPQRKAAIAANA